MINDVAQVVIALCTISNLVFLMHTNRAIKEVEKQTNHIKDELVVEVRAAAFAAGQKEQKEQKEKIP